MPKIKEICRHVRTKNAGPFWVTVDFFFRDADAYHKYVGSEDLGPDLFARMFGADPEKIKRIPVESLNMVKISYVRPKPQAWFGERDMHSGQLFARLLEVGIRESTAEPA
jgi:hypothetical protein